jgi:hypothetical protein
MFEKLGFGKNETPAEEEARLNKEIEALEKKRDAIEDTYDNEGKRGAIQGEIDLREAKRADAIRRGVKPQTDN